MVWGPHEDGKKKLYSFGSLSTETSPLATDSLSLFFGHTVWFESAVEAWSPNHWAAREHGGAGVGVAALGFKEGTRRPWVVGFET